jgi:hypothetical protein
MDPDRFRRLVDDPRRTRDELEDMERRAQKNGDAELIRIVRAALDGRFPGRKTVRTKASGARPATARFHDIERRFPTSKEAYVWLLENFVRHSPTALAAPQVSRGRTRNYFDRDPKKLFPASPHLAENQSMHANVGNGWYANLNLSNPEKRDLLISIARAARISDWAFVVEHPSTGLSAKLELEARAERALDEL